MSWTLNPAAGTMLNGRHDAVGQLPCAGLQREKADAVRPAHAERELHGQQRLAGARVPAEQDQVAGFGVDLRVDVRDVPLEVFRRAAQAREEVCRGLTGIDHLHGAFGHHQAVKSSHRVVGGVHRLRGRQLIIRLHFAKKDETLCDALDRLSHIRDLL